MGKWPAALLGFMFGGCFPGFILGAAFQDHDTPWLLGPVTCSLLGAATAARIAVPGPFIPLSRFNAWQFGLSDMLKLVCAVAVFLGIQKASGLWFAAFLTTLIAGVRIGSHLGHGRTFGILIGAVFAFFAPLPVFPNALLSIVGGATIARLFEQWLEILYRPIVNDTPRRN
jgi:hypothetical protein